MIIREALKEEFEDVMTVERRAFGEEDEANLVRDLLDDPSAEPRLSLLAIQDGKAIGHILFTRAVLEPESSVKVSLLAPLAVIPEAQGQGVGGALIQRGLEILTQCGTDLVFVLGHPGYYPRHGFNPAGALGLDAPYPIPAKDAGAWMVQALSPDILGTHRGKLKCADMLDKPEYWRE